MTIKEIAKLANVSISTVSKIMNGKDDSISAETREKVLKVAKEYNYSPYSAMIQSSTSKKFLIGVLIGDEWEDEAILRGVTKQAGKAGYSVVCCQHGNSMEEERKAVVRLCHQKVDGVIWKRVSKESSQYQKYFEEKEITFICCDDWNPDDNYSEIYLDYGKLGYEATSHLLGHKHEKLACLTRKENLYAERFTKGFQKCLYDHQINSHEDLIKTWTPDLSINDFLLYGITGIVCSDEVAANWVLNQAKQNVYKVPEDLSVIGLSGNGYASFMDPPLTSIMIPAEKLGSNLCTYLLHRIENTEIEKECLMLPMNLFQGKTTATITASRMKKIVVVGSINMDAVVNVKKFAESGETLLAENMSHLPGGKGSNQAVGAAKLGARVSLIGKLGQDYEAKKLKDAMHQYGVDMEGVSETGMMGTGKAYITVQKNGESNIIVYPGANQMLSKEDLRQHSERFDSASFCLMQLETPMKTVEYGAQIAKDKGVKVILKPAAVEQISDYLLKRTYIFLPNEKELHQLLPGTGSIEEKAQFFLDKGVKNVIVTLGHKGCYLRNEEISMFFSAADMEAVDTTGAADAFISALAVYLAEDYGMILAIKYATYAAGLSVTRQGVQSSLVDKQTLEMYGDEIANGIRTWGAT